MSIEVQPPVATGQVQIRPALRHEAEVVVALRAVMFQAMLDVDGAAAPVPAAAAADSRATDEEWRAAASRWVRDNVDEPLVRIIVAEVDGRIAAAGVGEVTGLMPSPSCPNGAAGLVSNVVVHPDYRGRGLARACTDAIIQWLTDETEVTRIDLFATPQAQAMYERRGFRIHRFPSLQRRVPR